MSGTELEYLVAEAFENRGYIVLRARAGIYQCTPAEIVKRIQSL